jgi:hypothetical protein
MTLRDIVEQIFLTAPKNEIAYRTMHQLLAANLAPNIENYAKSLSTEKGQGISKTVVKIVQVSPAAENNVSILNYRRAKVYIEFYNPNFKRCVRIILSTTGVPYFLIGYYSNYTKNNKNNKNNHFCKDTVMNNEFYGPVKLCSGVEFIHHTTKFLLGETESPYVSSDELDEPKLH